MTATNRADFRLEAIGVATESDAIEELVRAAARGDRTAQSRLLERYWALIRLITHERRMKSGQALRLREETEDLQQDIALHLLREVPKHEWRGKRAFIAWMRKIAEARVLEAGRHHSAKKRNPEEERDIDELSLPDPHPSRSPEMKVDRLQSQQLLLQLLDQLKPAHQVAVRLSAMGYTTAEIGEMVGCSPEAARKLVARGISKLQRLHSSMTRSSAR